jgi:hypothetical protein
VKRAMRGVSELPNSNLFAGEDIHWNYELSYQAAAVIAERFGEGRLWELFATMKRRVGQRMPDEHQDAILRRAIGMTSAELAQAAAERLVAAAR